LGDGKKSDLVAAPDEEKNPLLFPVKYGPGRDTMRPIICPARVGTISDAWHYLFWQRWARPEGSRDRPADAVPYPARLLPALTAAVPCSCPVEMPWIFLYPPDAHATRRMSPCSGSHPPTRTPSPSPPQGAILMRPSGPTERRNRARR
jgi:hypothetical protein